jgi:hypothetical protein
MNDDTTKLYIYELIKPFEFILYSYDVYITDRTTRVCIRDASNTNRQIQVGIINNTNHFYWYLNRWLYNMDSIKNPMIVLDHRDDDYVIDAINNYTIPITNQQKLVKIKDSLENNKVIYKSYGEYYSRKSLEHPVNYLWSYLLYINYNYYNKDNDISILYSKSPCHKERKTNKLYCQYISTISQTNKIYYKEKDINKTVFYIVENNSPFSDVYKKGKESEKTYLVVLTSEQNDKLAYNLFYDYINNVPIIIDLNKEKEHIKITEKI